MLECKRSTLFRYLDRCFISVLPTTLDARLLHHDKEGDVSTAAGSCSQFLVELLQLDNGPCEYDALLHILLVEYILGCMAVQMDSHAWLEMADRRFLFLHDDHLGLARSIL